MISPDADQIALFVECYVRNGDPVASCVESRILDPMYSVQTIAARLMETPAVLWAIAAYKRAKPDTVRVEITRESILADAQSIYESALKNDPKTALAAKRLQAELQKFLSQDVNINVKHDVTTMTDEQLAKIAAGKPIDAEFTDITPVPKGLAQIQH